MGRQMGMVLTVSCFCFVRHPPTSCQTYEGGFGGEPGYEAHGGYVFCAFAALVILGRARDADIDSLEVSQTKQTPQQDVSVYIMIIILLFFFQCVCLTGLAL